MGTRDRHRRGDAWKLVLEFHTLFFKILDLHLVQFDQLRFRFFSFLGFLGFLGRRVLLREDLRFGLFHESVEVLLVGLVGKAGVILAAVTFACYRLSRIPFTPNEGARASAILKTSRFLPYLADAFLGYRHRLIWAS